MHCRSVDFRIRSRRSGRRPRSRDYEVDTAQHLQLAEGLRTLSTRTASVTASPVPAAAADPVRINLNRSAAPRIVIRMNRNAATTKSSS